MPDSNQSNGTAAIFAALTFAADHISLYQLTIETGTVFEQAYARGETPNVPLLIAGLDKACAERVSAAVRDEAACEEPEKAVRDCLCRIEQCDLAQQIEAMKKRLTEPAVSPEQRAELLREMQNLNLRMRGLR